tara:strand:- start:101 stop:682 length:582 start_codon:yes stop_codon:yes gene_type:complete
MSSIVRYRDSSNTITVADYLKQLRQYDNKNTIKQLLPDVRGELYLELGKASLRNNKKDSRNAVSFLEESVKYGNINALESLCMSVARGKGVVKDEPLALYYCKEAAEKGSFSSLTYNMLGTLLSKGVGQRRGAIPVNDVISAFKKSCDLKDGSGCCELAKIYHEQEKSSLRDSGINLANQYNFPHCKQIIGLN